MTRKKQSKTKSRKPTSKQNTKTPFLKELSNMVLAVVMISLIFGYDWLKPESTFENFKGVLFPVSLSFALYELAQRIVARKLRANATYRLWIPGVVFCLMLMLVGIKLLLVGGIVISAYKFGRWGMKDRFPTLTEIGFISVAGPLTNMALALICNMLAGPGANPVFLQMATINSWLAFFNLVPIKELDGGKVMFWSPMMWLVLLFLTMLLFTSSGMLVV